MRNGKIVRSWVREITMMTKKRGRGCRGKRFDKVKKVMEKMYMRRWSDHEEDDIIIGREMERKVSEDNKRKLLRRSRL